MPWLLFLLVALVAGDMAPAAEPAAPLRRVAQASAQRPPPLLEARLEPEPDPELEPDDGPLTPAVPGQSKEDFQKWYAASAAVRAQMLGFESFLKGQGVKGVISSWQLARTASDHAKCGGPAFEVPPPAEWNHIADTLRFIGKHVEPVVGPVEALSGYRNAELNACAGGAKESAHRRFHALDLTPLKLKDRAAMIRSICAIHAFRGPEYDVGLGFYQGMRFHIDSKGFRKWGPNGKGATSPCKG